MKTIELIDKYEIRQGNSDYDPPSYVWVDNTGELIRCRDCDWWEKQEKSKSMQGRCSWHNMYPTESYYCGSARKRNERKINQPDIRRS